MQLILFSIYVIVVYFMDKMQREKEGIKKDCGTDTEALQMP